MCLLQAKQSTLKRKYGRKAAGAVKDANFYRELRSSGDIDMSLMVRASRNLPINLLHAEYSKILTRRIQRVGGVTTDGALHELLQCFRQVPHQWHAKGICTVQRVRYCLCHLKCSIAKCRNSKRNPGR